MDDRVNHGVLLIVGVTLAIFGFLVLIKGMSAMSVGLPESREVVVDERGLRVFDATFGQ